MPYLLSTNYTRHYSKCFTHLVLGQPDEVGIIIYYYLKPLFTDEETMAQRSQVTCLRSHS